MTTVTLVSLMLFSWMVSSGTWLSLDNCTDPSHHGHDGETEASGSSATCINAVICDKMNLTQTCERILTKGSSMKNCSLSPAVTLNSTSFKRGGNLLPTSNKTVNRIEQSEPICKCKSEQWLVHPLSKTSCKPPIIGRETDSHSNQSIGSRCCCIMTRVLMNPWEAADFLCEASQVQILPTFLCRKKILITSKCLMSKKAHTGICCQQMSSKFHAVYCLEDVFLTQPGSVESAWAMLAGRWVQRLILAAVLLLGIYTTRIKMAHSNRIGAAHSGNATMVVLFTMTFHSFSPSLALHRPPEWSHIAVEISFVVCLSCALGRAVHMLLACRTAHTVVTLLCPRQQKFRALPVTVLLFWLTFRPLFPNKNPKQWFEDIFVETSLGSTLSSWAILKQLEILATLFCVFMSLPCLLQSIVTKLNFLSVFLHVQLVTCLQNTRVPIKYVLVIRINRII